jgi:SAM-dependent MidA family methyltransferase
MSNTTPLFIISLRLSIHALALSLTSLFLISLGIDEYLLNEKDENKRSSLAQQIKQLVLPNAMGESFKVLALKHLSVPSLR